MQQHLRQEEHVQGHGSDNCDHRQPTPDRDLVPKLLLLELSML